MQTNRAGIHAPLQPWMSILVVCLLAAAGAESRPAGRQADSLAQTITVRAGWNVISLPVGTGGSPKDSLFPTSVSAAFRFDSGYGSVDTLEHGYGFWLKFAADDTISVPGLALFDDTIGVHAGWNLIGSISTSVAVIKIQANPPGIVRSKFFSFTSDSGYRSTDTLKPGAGYWVKAAGTGSLVLRSLDVPCPGVPLVDYAGLVYHPVQIAGQCWLRENLNVGELISVSLPQTDNGTIEKYCWIDEPVNCVKFGGLYQWTEVMQYSTSEGAGGICPPGWHLPTLEDFRTLDTVTAHDANHIKALHQGSDDGAGTNLTGFSALLSGYRHLDGSFSMLGFQTYFWTSTGSAAATVPALYLFYYYNDYFFYDLDKGFGLSVRCLKGWGAEGTDPFAPTEPSPADSSTDQPVDLTLSWISGDPEGDPLTYDVYLGTENPPVVKVAADLPGPILATTGLNPGSRYYWKVVARDNHGNSTGGPVWKFITAPIPCPGSPTVAYSGKTYGTVMIGAQCWLRENLDVGTMIPGAQDAANNATVEKYCYDDSAPNCALYGGLYRWSEAMQYATAGGSQGICPPGWHIPTTPEFNVLKLAAQFDGNDLKAVGEGSGDGAGTNLTGFSALLAGSRNPPGSFTGAGGSAFIWSSTEQNSSTALDLQLDSPNDIISLTLSAKVNGLSVRCLKD